MEGKMGSETDRRVERKQEKNRGTEVSPARHFISGQGEWGYGRERKWEKRSFRPKFRPRVLTRKLIQSTFEASQKRRKHPIHSSTEYQNGKPRWQ